MSKPKPCPFCGTTESIQIDTDTNTCTGTIMHWYATVQCNECEQSEVVLTGDTEEEAIANAISAWNTRHIEDELKVALEATEAERNELETYVSKLVYALTDGKMSKPYDIPVITDAVESIYQEYIREAVAKTEAENERLRERLEAALDKIAEIQDEWESEGVCHACGICAGIPYEWQRPDGFCCRVALGLWIEGKPLPWKDAARRVVEEEGREDEKK